METILSIHNRDLEKYNPSQAVEIFRDLLHAEAMRLMIPISKIHVSQRINVPDGGVDARVEKLELDIDEDLIRKGDSSYQIKASKTINLSQPSSVKTELFGDKGISTKNLGSEVRKCMDVDGTYIFVNFSQDLTESERTSAEENFVSCFRKCGYKNPKVEVWGQTQLIGFLKRFPSLALRINGRGQSGIVSHDIWGSEAEMRRPLKLGVLQEESLVRLRDELRKTPSEHIRLIGEPGVGKTRMALEATRTEDLSSLVIYTKAGIIKDSPLMLDIIRDQNLNLILVVDECDQNERAYIWNKIKPFQERVKLISIYNEPDTSTGIARFDVPILEHEQIIEIIEEYNIPRDTAQRWASLCDGIPRVAHVVGTNLSANPKKSLNDGFMANIHCWD